MRSIVILFFLIYLAPSAIKSQPLTKKSFDELFFKKTLRIDFELGGNSTTAKVFMKELKEEPFWSGPLTLFLDQFNYGNLQYKAVDIATGDVIYIKGFSSLFEEWQATNEAKSIDRAYYQVAFMPYPKQKIRFEVDQREYITGNFKTIFSTEIDPSSYFIQKEKPVQCKSKLIIGNGDPNKSLDIAVIAEGYTSKEMKKFNSDIKRVLGYIINHPPFCNYRDKINVYAIESPSDESGVDYPGERIYKKTATNFSYFTFNVDRYLTTSDAKTLYDLAANVPYDHVFVLINTTRYGGGGFYNFYTATTVDHKLSLKVGLHEFGHGFGGLADEYYNSSVATEEFYNLKVEPWEPNITTNVNFDSKWKGMIAAGTPIPTPADSSNIDKVGMYEGGGYVAKGIYRPVIDCGMKSNNGDQYCPVCQKAVEKRLKFYFDEKPNL